MEPRDFEQNENRLDRWLDAALHEYGSAEPRVGLEGRVLANLAAERARATTQRWWVWGVAAAMACVGVLAWIGGMNHRSAGVKFAGSTAPAEQKIGAANGQAGVKRPVTEATHRRVRERVAKQIEVAAEPRLSQFPSPRGLSEQEQLLVRYVTESPDEAVLVAKERAERRLEIESGDGGLPTGPENSNQEER